ncbi:hypothetical protein, partial [Streptomyces sp. NPDC007917]|uniref:hypothetical protein n=1 Tax=Streptomyces sp. NPDC007917 TaxID=3364793 RepID=UPI0036E2700E
MVQSTSGPDLPHQPGVGHTHHTHRAAPGHPSLQLPKARYIPSPAHHRHIRQIDQTSRILEQRHLIPV